jgi:hypothetical protein
MHRAVPLVSHRWWRAAHSPPLLAALDIELPSDPDEQQTVLALQSFAGWLVRHAANHLVRLKLKQWRDRELPYGAVPMQQAALLSAALAHCCAAGKLAVLDLDFWETGVCFEPLF